MPADELTAEELRYVLVAKIARDRLLELRGQYPEDFLRHAEAEGVTAWRACYWSEVDAVLDEAIDAADVAILAHS